MKTIKIDIMPSDYKALKSSPYWLYIFLLYTVITILFLSVYYIYHYQTKSKVTRDRNFQLQKQKRHLEKLSKFKIQFSDVQALARKWEKVNAIQENKTLPWYNIMDEMEQAMVGIKHVYVKEIKTKGNEFDLTCFAKNLEDAAAFLKNMLKSALFTKIDYKVSKRDTLYANEGNYFSLKFQVREGIRGQ
ncbi:PilN domain-containing protein [Candidatus Riflebacteria bacterium]